MFSSHLYGLGQSCQNLLSSRLELTTFSNFLVKKCYVNNYAKFFSKNLVKTLNIIFSQISNVNSSLIELKKINIIRKYLVKTYQGYCHVIGKPVRGQRTWSNSWNSFKCNNLLRQFITKIKYINKLLH